MSLPVQPIYLLADSQLLFWDDNGVLLTDTMTRIVRQSTTRAAYIGASNGDQPDFYSIFQAAMENVGIRDCQMIMSSFSQDDRAFLEQANIILLAGGEVGKGWNVMKETGMGETILSRHQEGALLIGVSAGAVQLGVFGWPEGDFSPADVFETLKLVPFVIGAHDEKAEWQTLKDVVRMMNGYVKGIGIPSGGGLVYYPDQSLAPIRHALYELALEDGAITQTLLLPDSGAKRGDQNNQLIQ